VLLCKLDDGQFKISVKEESNDIDINISPLYLQIFLLRSIVYIVSNIEEAQVKLGLLRSLSYIIKNTNDYYIQYMLREVDSETLVLFLEYMDNNDLIGTITQNCSMTASEILLDDLESYKRNSSITLENKVKKGQEAMANVTDVLMDVLSEHGE